MESRNIEKRNSVVKAQSRVREYLSNDKNRMESTTVNS